MMGSLRDRVLSQLIVEPATGCLLWTGSINSAGYGQVGTPEGTKLVHRLMHEWFTGPIPDGLQIDHLCRVRHCAAPAHLEAVTASLNLLRGYSWQRAKTHCKQGHPFDDANTYWRASAPHMRACRACVRESQRRHRARLTAAT